MRQQRASQVGPMAAFGLIALGVATLAVGCGPPREERIAAALDRAREPLQDVHRTLVNAARILPLREDGLERGCVAEGLEPIMADFRPTSSRPGNLDVMMVADVKAPWESHSYFPMARSSRLAQPMSWLIGNEPIPESTAASEVEWAVEKALGVRYVLLFRVVDYESPHALSVKEFTGGRIDADFFLVDLEKSQVVCILPCVGVNDETLFYFRSQGLDEASRIQEFQKVLEENVYSSARRDAYARLKTLVPESKVMSY